MGSGSRPWKLFSSGTEMPDEPEKGSVEWIKAEQAKITPEPSTPASRRRMLIGWIALAVLVVGVIVVASFAFSKPNHQASAPTEYEQTWASSYSDTSCDDWNSQMTGQQRFAAAADMLSAARDKGDGAVGVAPDDLISDFEDGISNACVSGTQSLAETGAVLYLTERTRYQP
jgi:hypothetical protein